MSESNRLFARSDLSERGDDAAIEAGFVLKVTFPKRTPRRVKSSQREDPDLVRLRKLLRKRIRTTINAIRPRHVGRRLAIRTPARSQLCVAQSGRHSRSRRTPRVARAAAKRATGDPDPEGPGSAYLARGALAEDMAFVIDAVRSLRDEAVPAREHLRTISWGWSLLELRSAHPRVSLISCYNSGHGCQEGRDADHPADPSGSAGIGRRSENRLAPHIAIRDQDARQQVEARTLHHEGRSGSRAATRTAIGSQPEASS